MADVDLLERVRVVLVEPSHPGNVGAAARAMKTMGLCDLVMVAPRRHPHPEATWRAAGGADVLAKARVVDALGSAIDDCVLVAATSARPRRIPWPTADLRGAAAQLIDAASTGPVAVLFGREASGLTNDELQRAALHVHVPANPDYPVLNLGMAVQLMAYELRMACSHWEAPGWDRRPATSGEIEGMLEHLASVLQRIDYLDLENPRQTMTRLRRLFTRASLDVTETQMLRGIFRAIERDRSS